MVNYHPEEFDYGIILVSLAIMFFLGLFAWSLAHLIYLIWITLFIILAACISCRNPKTTIFIKTIPVLIICLVGGHVLFNSFIYFEPVPHSYGNTFCMKSNTNVENPTYVRADIGLPNTFIYIPFTKIKLYGTNVTYYIDHTQSTSSAIYQVVSEDGTLMNVSLMWNLIPYEYSNNDLEQLFYKRGPNWEINYAKSIATYQLAQDLASTRSAGALATPSWGDDVNFMLNVKTNDFEGDVSLHYEIADPIARDCYYQQLSNSIGPSTKSNQPTYGEPNQPPTYPVDSCQDYTADIDYNNQEPTTYDGLNRVSLPQ